MKDVNDFLVAELGMKLNRDMESKLTMLVKNYEETKWNKKKQALPTYVMEKLDGVCTIAININGRTRLFSRTGKRLNNVKQLEGMMALNSRKNTVYLVELCNDAFSLEQISGICNPNRVIPIHPEDYSKWMCGTYLGAFDMITLEDFLAGESQLPFEQRLAELERDVASRNLQVKIPAYILAYTEEEVEDFFNFVVDKGGEGVVRCLPNETWKAGYKNHDKTKMVRGVDYDLEIVGVEIGTKGKHKGIMNKLVVRWRKFGKPENAAVDLPVDGRFDLSARSHAALNPQDYIGKIAHVHALQLGSAGSLRLAKVRAIRMDKFEADL